VVFESKGLRRRQHVVTVRFLGGGRSGIDAIGVTR
jgi:hypothetical protein